MKFESNTNTFIAENTFENVFEMSVISFRDNGSNRICMCDKEKVGSLSIYGFGSKV